MAIEKLEGIGAFESIGMMLDICATSGSYLNWTLAEINQYFVPPVNIDQYAIFASEGRLVGFVTWAFLSDHHSRLLKEQYIEPDGNDWRSGDQLWIMDVVAKPGYIGEIARHIQKEIFRGSSDKFAYAIRRNTDASVRKVATFPAYKDLSLSNMRVTRH
jgi:hemolysin-activating ACP:hemolysin acyltransferase